MTTLEELQRQKRRLQIKREHQGAISRIQREKQQLKKEIKELKNPATQAFKRNVSRGLRTGGRATLNWLDRATRPVPVRKRRRR